MFIINVNIYVVIKKLNQIVNVKISTIKNNLFSVVITFRLPSYCTVLYCMGMGPVITQRIVQSRWAQDTIFNYCPACWWMRCKGAARCSQYNLVYHGNLVTGTKLLGNCRPLVMAGIISTRISLVMPHSLQQYAAASQGHGVCSRGDELIFNT